MTTPQTLHSPNKTALVSMYRPLGDRIENSGEDFSLKALAFLCEADCVTRPGVNRIPARHHAECC